MLLSVTRVQPLIQVSRKSLRRLLHRTVRRSNSPSFSEESILQQLDINMQYEKLLRSVRQAVGTDQVALIHLWPERGNVSVVDSSTAPDFEVNHGHPSLTVDSPLLRWMESRQVPITWEELVVLPQFAGMAPQEIAIFEDLQTELLVPLATHGTLNGILLVGPKTSLRRYTKADMGLLQSLAEQAAPIIEAARLYALEKNRSVELEVLNEKKSDYILVLTHQLRTPLTAIMASAGMLSQEPPVDAELRGRLINSVSRGVESLDRLITELTEYGKMRSATLELHMEKRDIGAIIVETCELVRPLADGQRITLTTQVSPSLPRVVIDPHRFQQILLNLVANAIKFTPEGGDITVLAESQDNRLLVTVIDTGVGVSPMQERWIFEAFASSSETSNGESSLGLGLAIAKALTELHHGEIQVESEEGKGSTFAINLPLIQHPMLEPSVQR